MANTTTSRTSGVANNVVTHPVGKSQGVHMYLKYTKGGGTRVTITLTFIDPKLNATDEYQPIYFGALMATTPLTIVLDTTGNYRVSIPMALGEETVKASVLFTDGANQALVVDFRNE